MTTMMPHFQVEQDDESIHPAVGLVSTLQMLGFRPDEHVLSECQHRTLTTKYGISSILLSHVGQPELKQRIAILSRKREDGKQAFTDQT
ncbi:hypothetical protein [Dictyobacter alpinus]|uniref:hypothetical protein n=1 Tax=Dictyobacter alpinus TaxID=2014873 RepID=UPI000F82A9DF|nr:hypothetical protein [Dictyobacter alpinus]